VVLIEDKASGTQLIQHNHAPALQGFLDRREIWNQERGLGLDGSV